MKKKSKNEGRILRFPEQKRRPFADRRGSPDCRNPVCHIPDPARPEEVEHVPCGECDRCVAAIELEDAEKGDPPMP